MSFFVNIIALDIYEFVIAKLKGSISQSTSLETKPIRSLSNLYCSQQCANRITSIIAFSVYMVAAIFTIKTFTLRGAVFSISPFWAGYNIKVRCYTISTIHMVAQFCYYLSESHADLFNDLSYLYMSSCNLFTRLKHLKLKHVHAQFLTSTQAEKGIVDNKTKRSDKSTSIIDKSTYQII